MKSGPDIARIAALIGDPARANILTALMSGKALTATELAGEAGITVATTSQHLTRLEDGGLIQSRRQGRHKYVTLASDDVAGLLENLMSVSAGAGHLRTRTGPKDAALREARVCYNHLAGDRGVQLYDVMLARGDLVISAGDLSLTDQGASFASAFGIDLAGLSKGRTALCRPCLDWSERRSHLAGGLGRAMFSRMADLGWLRRRTDSRVVEFTPDGLRQFNMEFRREV